jgi:ABC-2 type transport system permease protein
MIKLFSSIKKEILILSRDKAGMAILFLMPMLLIFIITIIQEGTFKTLNNAKISLVLVNNDKDSLGNAIDKGLTGSGYFQVVKNISGKNATPESASRSVADGHHQLAVIVPEHATSSIRVNASRMTQRMLEEDTIPVEKQRSEVKIFFDPVTKSTFKNSVISSLEKFISEIELNIFMQAFSKDIKKVLPAFEPGELSDIKTIVLREEYATNKANKVIPNSVQHNVPAWTIFAMFFIVIPLAGNIIKEKDYGTNLRLRTMPVSYFTVFSGKLVTYLGVCVIQFLLMMSVGLFFLPMLGLPVLKMGNSVAALITMVVASALAATGYGVLVGSLSSTREQAASFGSISVMILAAVGGIWVPVFAMPPVMRTLSAFSPLNWGLNGFYDIFLRNGNLSTIFPGAVKLLLFFAFSMTIAYYFNEYKNKQN